MGEVREIFDGKRVWKAYGALYANGEDFVDIGRDLERNSDAPKTSLENGTVTFMGRRELAYFAVERIELKRK